MTYKVIVDSKNPPTGMLYKTILLNIVSSTTYIKNNVENRCQKYSLNEALFFIYF